MQTFILSTLLFLVIISCNSDTSKTSISSPIIEKDPTPIFTVDSFISEGYSILAQRKADFNLDGFEDAVVILKNIHEQETSDYANNKPTLRPLLFLAGDKIGSLHLVARNDKAVYCIDCGGQMGDPFNELVVDKQLVSINHYGGSQFRWIRNITFKYDTEKKGWFLYKDEKENVSRIDSLGSTESDIQPLELFDLYAS